MPPATKPNPTAVIVALLLLDLLAFTMILPLFPQALHGYQAAGDADYGRWLRWVRRFRREWLGAEHESVRARRRFDFSFGDFSWQKSRSITC